MTTAPAPSPGQRITHYGTEVFLGGILIGAAGSLYEAITGNYLPWWLRIWGTVGIFGGIYLMKRHGARLCDQCIARWPLDPTAEVRRHDHRLRRFHLVMDSLEYGGTAKVWIAVGIFLVVVTLLPQPFDNLLIFIANVGLFAFFLAGRTHDQLEPWCPYCRRGRDDDHFFPEPVTPPAAKITK